MVFWYIFLSNNSSGKFEVVQCERSRQLSQPIFKQQTGQYIGEYIDYIRTCGHEWLQKKQNGTILNRFGTIQVKIGTTQIPVYLFYLSKW